MEDIVNRVALSGILTLDLEDFRPDGERAPFDLAEVLFQGLILRENDLRAFVKEHDWAAYTEKHVAIFCSADAIVPSWAYMLVAGHLQPYAKTVFFGQLSDLEIKLYMDALSAANWKDFAGKRVVIKGCSENEVPVAAYVEATNRLRPMAQSIMFGEACSTVPLFKKPKATLGTAEA